MSTGSPAYAGPVGASALVDVFHTIRTQLNNRLQPKPARTVHEGRHVLPGEDTMRLPIDTPPPSLRPSPPEPAEPQTAADKAAESWTLVQRAQAGDNQAWAEIYDRYTPTIANFIYLRTGNRPLAEDLTGDTWVRALSRIQSFTFQGRDFGAWLVTIARNLVADYFRSGRYRLEFSGGHAVGSELVDYSPEGNPADTAIDRVNSVVLLTAITQLSPDQKDCIILRFIQGFSVPETAQIMGKNSGSVKALQYRAVRALARILPDPAIEEVTA